MIRRHYAVFWMSDDMWNRNFMFRSAEATPLKESENELFHDTDPAMDSTGLQLEKFLSVWILGDGGLAGHGTCVRHDGRWSRRAGLRGG